MAIFGDDDRLAVISGTDAPPLSAFAQIVSLFPDGTVTQGSGVLVGPDDLLTAAHVIYREEHGGWATQAQVTPGRYLDERPYGVFEATSISSPTEWRVDGSLAHDYGMITLETPVGYVAGWLNYGYVEDATSFIGHNMIALGYPYDQGGEILHYNSGTIDRVEENILYFMDDLDTMPGQSGSPLIHNNNGSDIVLGIVSHQLISPDENGVIALTEDSVNQIDEWSGDEVAYSVLNPVYYQTGIEVSIQIIRLLEVIYNQQPGYAVLSQYSSEVVESGLEEFANALVAGETLLDADDILSATVVTNAGITGDAVAIAVDYMMDQLSLAVGAGRGAVILEATELFAGMTDHQLFGGLATDYNSEVVDSVAYSVVPDNVDVRTVDDSLPQALLL